MLREFLSHPKIAAVYEGHTVVRLLPQRWSGHLSVAQAVYSNYDAILDILKKVKAGKYGGDDFAKSSGLLTVM